MVPVAGTTQARMVSDAKTGGGNVAAPALRVVPAAKRAAVAKVKKMRPEEGRKRVPTGMGEKLKGIGQWRVRTP